MCLLDLLRCCLSLKPGRGDEGLKERAGTTKKHQLPNFFGDAGERKKKRKQPRTRQEKKGEWMKWKESVLTLVLMRAISMQDPPLFERPTLFFFVYTFVVHVLGSIDDVFFLLLPSSHTQHGTLTIVKVRSFAQDCRFDYFSYHRSIFFLLYLKLGQRRGRVYSTKRKKKNYRRNTWRRSPTSEANLKSSQKGQTLFFYLPFVNVLNLDFDDGIDFSLRKVSWTSCQDCCAMADNSTHIERKQGEKSKKK